MTRARRTLVLAASAERTLPHLPTKVASAVVEFMLGPLLEDPRRVGRPLRRDLAGLWSARRGAYRIVHALEGTQVQVLRIDHRADVYRAR